MRLHQWDHDVGPHSSSVNVAVNVVTECVSSRPHWVCAQLLDGNIIGGALKPGEQECLEWQDVASGDGTKNETMISSDGGRTAKAFEVLNLIRLNGLRAKQDRATRLRVRGVGERYAKAYGKGAAIGINSRRRITTVMSGKSIPNSRGVQSGAIQAQNVLVIVG